MRTILRRVKNLEEQTGVNKEIIFIFGNVRSAVLGRRRTLKIKVFSDILHLTEDQLVDIIAKFW